jgi:phospholipase C
MKITRRVATSLALASILTPTFAPFAAAAPAAKTPIQHVIIIVGENHTFDNLFGTYQPKGTQTIQNLRSKGIVNPDGTPGPNFSLAAQNIANVMGKYQANTNVVATYPTLPQPYTTSGLGLPQGVPDTRFPANLPNGPYQISDYVPYAAYTGDPVHRFFQMWQDVDAGKMDKFVYVEETIGTGSNGAPPPAAGSIPRKAQSPWGFTT